MYYSKNAAFFLKRSDKYLIDGSDRNQIDFMMMLSFIH